MIYYPRRDGKTYLQQKQIEALTTAGIHFHVSLPEGDKCVNGYCELDEAS